MVRESSASVTTAGPIPTETDLAQALIDGYPDAPALAWRRYHPLVRGMLRRALGAGDDLDDVVQDVFLSLFRCARALRKHEALRPFVIAITRHTLLRERRRRMRRRQFASEYGPWLAQAEVGGGPAASYATIRLNGLLRRLPEQERASFVLRFAHGMTVSEVAEVLRVSEPTAKRRLSRAQASLGAWAARDQLLVDHVRATNSGLNAGMD
jgi:RNA polymerase sigma-70 factor, ECF subfamily